MIRTFRNIRLGVKNLLLHKLRSALTVLGVVFGVGSVIAMLSVIEGVSQQTLDRIRRLGSNNIMINSVEPISDANSTERSWLNNYGLLESDFARIDDRRRFPQFKRVVPAKTTRKAVRVDDREVNLRVVGTTAEWFELVRRPVLVGRTLSGEDASRMNNSAVITEHVARALFAGGSTVGRRITIDEAVFEVVGIVSSDEAGPEVQLPDQRVDIYIPLPVLIERFGEYDVQRSSGSFRRELVELHQILIEVDQLENVEPAGAALERLLELHHTQKDYDLRIPVRQLREAEETKRTSNIVLGSIAGISLLVGGMGIMNIMLASVTERTREIGVRRAIGAKRRQIIYQFLVESVVLSTVGGFAGMAVGVLLPVAIEHFFEMPTIITPFSLILSVGISMGIGIFFGLYPAIRAANLDPIVALRHE